MNVLSLFDGISCGRIALNKANITVTNYYSSEVDIDALKVANQNYPEDIPNRLGNVYDIDIKRLPKIDLLIGGSPCQDLSVANIKRLGLKGSKSKLFFEFVRILKEVNPKYFLFENVRMAKDQQDIISNLLGYDPIIINSSKLSVQLRHRLYWTNISNISQPTDLNLKLNDYLTSGYSDRTKSRTLLSSDSNPMTTPISMYYRYVTTGFTTLIFKDKNHFDSIKAHYNKYFANKNINEIKLLSSTMDLSIYEGIRYLNTKEREICQTMPINYTSCLTRNKAAKVLGAGWTIDVIAHIFKHLHMSVM